MLLLMGYCRPECTTGRGWLRVRDPAPALGNRQRQGDL